MRKDNDNPLTNVVEINFKERKAPRAEATDAQLCESKHELFANWLREGKVCVLFDARHPAAKVPAEFKNRGDLRLNFCYDFHIADFNFNANSIWGSLAFESGEFFCVVPFEAIYGLQSADLKQGAVWFQDFPKDYDQCEVLGFSEDLKEGFIEAADDEEIDDNAPSIENVIAFDFSKRR